MALGWTSFGQIVWSIFRRPRCYLWAPHDNFWKRIFEESDHFLTPHYTSLHLMTLIPLCIYKNLPQTLSWDDVVNCILGRRFHSFCFSTKFHINRHNHFWQKYICQVEGQTYTKPILVRFYVAQDYQKKLYRSIGQLPASESMRARMRNEICRILESIFPLPRPLQTRISPWVGQNLFQQMIAIQFSSSLNLFGKFSTLIPPGAIPSLEGKKAPNSILLGGWSRRSGSKWRKLLRKF